MKLLPLLAFGLAALIPSLGAADTRVFTDISGRTITAEIVTATVQTVTLKLADGTTPTIAQSRLSDADKAFLQGWIKANPGAQGAPAQAAQKTSLKVDWTSERVSKKLRPTDEPPPFPEGRKPTIEEITLHYKGLHEEWVCHFKITNLGREPLTNLRVDYVVHSERPSPMEREPYKNKAKGTRTIQTLGAFQNVTVDSDRLNMSGSVHQTSYSSKSGGSVSGHKELTVEKIVGTEVTLFLDGVEVCRYVSPGIRSSVPKAGEAR